MVPDIYNSICEESAADTSTVRFVRICSDVP